MPPGYFGLICPSLLSVRQYGVMRLRPCCANSTAAYAAIHEKMPVVIGQVKSVLCFFASAVPEFVDGGQFALRHLFHQRINLERSWDNKTAFAVLRQIFGIEEFSIPINAHSLNCDREITPSEAF